MLPMPSTMMDRPLLIKEILWRAEKLYAYRQVVTQREAGEPRRSTYGGVAVRARKLASALERAGVRPGDRVATFGWNTQTHLECYFAIPCMGAVLHTINVRLFHDQLEYIINHAEDQVVFCDRSVLPVFEQLAGKIPSVRLVVLMNEGPGPSTDAFQTVDYEEFLGAGSESFDWPDLDERSAAGMCYTSGTTGNPKGVVYSHRSTFLHSLVAGLPNSTGVGEHDAVMYAVPMFHANAWGLPYTCALAGAAQVLSDRFLDPQRVVNLLDSEGVTISAGVPTIWIGVLNLLETSGRRLPKLRRVLCGGSAAPPALIDGLRRNGIELVHAWGMTETSPLGSLTRIPSVLLDAPEAEQNKYRYKQGQIVPTIECRIVDVESGRELPWDGVAFGELQVRGPYITGSYYHDPQSAEKFSADGWLRTGDVATIDQYGFIQLVDRTKDLVKSGGEWISSVELENLIMAHPKVLEAAVVGLPHPKWDERPVAAVVLKPDQMLTADEVRAFLSDKVAKWWLPDEVLFVESLPKTSVGKFAKNHLREQLAEVARRWAAVG
ncbi:MAG TPA: long-chain fatty acid--CoA ligase [Dehalococcoidia bacterium]|nr:long-chain fatty acid--CoA ligase [Dehalococcoidia bacterium]